VICIGSLIDPWSPAGVGGRKIEGRAGFRARPSVSVTPGLAGTMRLTDQPLQLPPLGQPPLPPVLQVNDIAPALFVMVNVFPLDAVTVRT
jgi:hypothetical protein